MPRSGKAEFVSVPTGTAVLVIPGSSKRVSLTLFGSTVGRITLGNDSGLTLDNGPTFIQSQGPIILTYEIHGELVRQPWFGIAAVANSVMGYIESLEG